MTICGLQRTVSVSFPRSGHHYLARILQEYFGDLFQYHSVYASDEKFHGVKSVPLEQANFIKTHDGDLTTPVEPGVKYLVQIRNPLDSMESWVDFDRLHAGLKPGSLTRPEWETRMEGQLELFAGLVRKWIFADIPDRLIVTYERLVVSPELVMGNIIKFISADSWLIPERLQTILKKYPAWTRPTLGSPFYRRASVNL